MNAFRIFVSKKNGFDTVSQKLLEEINYNLHLNIKGIKLYNGYDIFDIEDSTKNIFVKKVLSDTVTDEVVTDVNLENKSFVAYKLMAGQFDVRSYNAIKCLNLLSTVSNELALETFELIVFDEKLDEKLDEKTIDLIKNYLINPAEKCEKDLLVLEKPVIPEKDEILDIKDFKNYTEKEILDVKEKLGINLDLETLLFIQKYYKENDYDCLSTELYLFDTYWSDHCRHTTFSTILENITFDDSENSKYVKSSYEKYIKRNKEINRNKPLTLMNLATFNAKYLEKKGKLSNVLQSEEVNACSFYHKINGEDYLVMFKNETHNHPTEIEPFGGAGTCLGGAIRDPLSGRSYVYQGIRITGAANPLEDIKDTLENKLPQSKICKDSAKGFSSYGNQIGMATTYVKEVYHESYKAKRLELGAVVGSVKAKDTKREVPIPSDIILLLGGRTGKDGIGGASGSSLSHEEDSLKTAMEQIQKGNPLEERKLQRLFRNGEFSILVKRCNDFGAGGVSVAIGELADGIEVWLDKIKLKTKNINYSQIAISESQERMAIVIDKNDLSKVKELCKAENVEVTEVGVVTNTNKVVMKYDNEVVASIDREFLNTNGLTYYQNVLVKNDIYHDYDKQLYKKLNNYSQKGLIEIFDSSVSKSTILAPLGGKNQITTQLGSVSLINAENNSEEVSVVTHGFTPTVSEYSPYLAGIYAVVEAVCKNITLGGQIENMYISMQEYFPSLKKDDKKWGLVFQALLGAFEAMDNLEIGAIGGKDSMSGTYKDMDVISTIVAFAFTAFNKSKIISRELKEENSNIYLVKMKTDEFGYPLFDELKETFKNINDIRKCILSISTLEDGITNTLNNMSYGNDISYELHTDVDLDNPYYGSFVIESKEEIVLDNFIKIGVTKSCLSVEEIECKNEHLNGLYSVYPFTRNDICALEDYKNVSNNKIYFAEKVKNPKVLIVCFSGTNSELDMEKCFRENGTHTKILVINDKTNDTLKKSIDVFVEELLLAHILVFPGGFSFSDEPDGSGKFIANFLRNDVVKKAVHKHLEEKKLVLGICNGFQGLIKSGLLPYGEIKDLDENSPTLFYNDNFRHIAKSVKTYVASNKSPWLQDVDMDKAYTLPISHGEGKFVCTGEMLEYLKQNDLIATRYLEENPNGSSFNIEGIVSLDGLVLGKMAHNERSNNELFVNIDGEKDQNIFKSAVNYFNGGVNTMNNNFLYEGKAKILYDNNDGTVTILYKDDATAFNGVKKDVLVDKGIYNNKISSIIYTYLKENDINTHFVEKISDREQICKKVDIIPLEVIIRNVAAGSMAKRLGLEEGHELSIPVFELSYKDDSLGDPLINSDHAIALSIVTQEELELIKDTALKINELLSKLFLDKNILLVDFKIEFGKDENGNIVLADEISPDTCRFWEKDTKEKYDKDRFRRDLEDVMKGYTSILEILEV